MLARHYLPYLLQVKKHYVVVVYDIDYAHSFVHKFEKISHTPYPVIFHNNVKLDNFKYHHEQQLTLNYNLDALTLLPNLEVRNIWYYQAPPHHIAPVFPQEILVPQLKQVLF